MLYEAAWRARLCQNAPHPAITRVTTGKNSTFVE
jgi:hypothetical protein